MWRPEGSRESPHDPALAHEQCCSQAEGEDELPKVKVRRTYSLPSSLMDQSCHRVASSGPSLETV